METGFVKTSVENFISTITFFHPQSNSLPGVLLRELAAAINQSSHNPEVRVILLKSDGEKAFCAGASFDELVQIDDKDSGTYFFSGFAAVINAIRKSPVFVVGRVHGKAVGGGVGLASACDYTFATRNADVKLSELAVGIGPFVVGPAVERKIGASSFGTLAINAAKWFSAEWAYSKGLYAELFDTSADMDQGINQLLNTLSSSSPEAMQEIKTVLWRGTENWDTLLAERAAISGRLVLSSFTRNAISKFKSR